MKHDKPKASTSWEPIGQWYRKAVGKDGLYYHKQVILPGVMKLLELDKWKDPSVLDLACGQGIFGNELSGDVHYHGIDLAPTLIQEAKRRNKKKTHRFHVADATDRLPITKRDFSHVVIMLAIQNIKDIDALLANAHKHLRMNGKLIIAMNHPCFRIPRQSSWGIDKDKKIQYRRLDCYMTPTSIPIKANPGKGCESESTWSFHFPLSKYFESLSQAGFAVDRLEEWCSDKKSTGPAARMENRARMEFPLFLCLRAMKLYRND